VRDYFDNSPEVRDAYSQHAKEQWQDEDLNLGTSGGQHCIKLTIAKPLPL
jgi:hypothetical protein